MEESFPSGTLVLVRNLRKKAEFNDRHGIVLRAASINPRGPCANVYMYETWDASSLVISVLPVNLERDHTLHYIEDLSTKKPPISLLDLPLRPVFRPDCHYIPTEEETAHVPPKNAYGVTQPVYLLPGISREAAKTSILLLAGGDLRSVLFSIARERLAVDPPFGRGPLHITFNESDVTIVARNVLILHLLDTSSVPTYSILVIWTSLRLGHFSYTVLCNGIAALTSPSSEDVLSRLNIFFHTNVDRAAVRAKWRTWISWQDDLDWRKIQVPGWKQIDSALGHPREIENSKHVRKVKLFYLGNGQILQCSSAGLEITSLLENGSFLPEEVEPDFANPTFFQSQRPPYSFQVPNPYL